MESEKQKHPFELIVGNETGEIMNGDVPVRWCVTPELVKKLEDDKIVDPHVLLVTADDHGREMQRQLVPITELMTYVRFTKAGKMRLYGFIIDGAEGRKKLYRMYQRKVSGGYETDIMFHYTSEPHDDLYGEYIRTSAIVEIPAGVFGKEPGPWMKWFVNLWHTDSGRVVDECHYRRRLMLAFSLKWIPVTIWATLLVTGRVLVTGLLKLAGYWTNVNFLRSFRPFHYGSMEFHLLDDFSFLENDLLVKRKYKKSYGRERTTTMWFTLPFIPLMLLIELLLVVFVFKEGTSILTSMGIMVGVVFTLVALWDAIIWAFQWFERTEIFEKMSRSINRKLEAFADTISENVGWKPVAGLAIVLVLIGFGFLFTVVPAFVTSIIVTIFAALAVAGLLIKFQEPIIEWLDNAYTVTPEHNDYTEIRELLCPKDADNLRPDIHFIPPAQRTIRLRYLDIKNKVCKPMQM